MTVALLLISDGRDEYLARTRASLAENLPPFDHVVHVDDAAHELGFAGAIQEGWRRILETDAQWIWHAEQDFTFNFPVPLPAMIQTLEQHPHLAQLALRRQPWNDQERAAGGIVEMHPGDYAEVACNGHRWLEHTRCFTTNPSVYPRWVAGRGWPDGPESEGHFGIGLRESDPALRFGYWGARDSGEACEHIGAERAGTGY